MKIKQIPDIAGSAETISRSCCLCHFPFAAKSDGDWDGHEFAIVHSLLFEIYFCLCVSSSWHNSGKQQKDGAFPPINRDQSLNFNWMTKQNQLLKVCFYLFLTPASQQLASSSQNQVPRDIEESSCLHIIYTDPIRGMGSVCTDLRIAQHVNVPWGRSVDNSGQTIWLGLGLLFCYWPVHDTGCSALGTCMSEATASRAGLQVMWRWGYTWC